MLLLPTTRPWQGKGDRVHMMLGLPNGLLEVVEPKNESKVSVEFVSLLNNCKH